MKTKFIALVAASAFLWSCDDNDVDKSTYKLNENQSVAEWKGYLETGYFNNGTISVQSDNLGVTDGKVSSGSFTIPLSSLVNLNLPTEALKEQLVHHLQSPDFFNMALHPSIQFDIVNVTPYSSKATDAIQGANYLVNGTLKILGKGNPVQFPAKISLENNGLSANGIVSIDRTKWGINYATSDTLAPEQKIKNMIDIHLKLVGTKK